MGVYILPYHTISARPTSSFDVESIRKYLQVLIMCAQPDSNNLVHYCRIPITVLEYVGSAPFTDDHDQRLERADQAWNTVEAWLKERGFVVRHATIAIPKDFHLTEGLAGFLIQFQETFSETDKCGS